MNNAHKGSTFDSFLEKEKLLDQVEATAIKRVIAHQLEYAMEKQRISKTKMANTMHTSRSSVDRLLDPENASVTLQSLVKAAHAVGQELQISFVD
jgi:antitoxin HicB